MLHILDSLDSILLHRAMERCILKEVVSVKDGALFWRPFQFEAQNMKNLVLKIIRGSYPPVPSKYTYDIRGLIAALFKRNPRDRPSINGILKMPFVQRRIAKLLSDDVSGESSLLSDFSTIS